jgi:hypothetical protein
MGLGVLLASAPPEARQVVARDTAGVPAFIRPDRCYRLTFVVAGELQWRVLETADDGWVKAEIDAGPASAQRESVWVNVA